MSLIGYTFLTLLHYFFNLTSFQRLGQKSLQKNCWFFGPFEDTKRTFRNQQVDLFLEGHKIRNNCTFFLTSVLSSAAVKHIFFFKFCGLFRKHPTSTSSLLNICTYNVCFKISLITKLHDDKIRAG